MIINFAHRRCSSTTVTRRLCNLFLLVLLAFLLFQWYKVSSKVGKDADYVTQTTNMESTAKRVNTAIPQISDDESAAQRFTARRKHLKKACDAKMKNRRRSKWKNLLNFLVDIPSRLLVCAVPKSGSSSWLSIVWAINRKREGLDFDHKLYTSEDTKKMQGIPGKVSSEDGNKLIQPVKGDDDFMKPPSRSSSFRLILARHPFARLISGWNQKFSTASNYWVFLMQHYPALLKFRVTKTKNHVMSFSDFATFLTKNYGSGRYFDSHFHPATQLCRICEYDYTYILKAESLEIDQKWIMGRMNLSDISPFRAGFGPSGGVDHKNVAESIKNYTSQLTPQTLARLYNLYRSDFEYFGYTFNLSTREAGGFT